MTGMLSQADKQGCGAVGFATAELRAEGKNEHRVCYNTDCSYNSCLCRAVQLLEKGCSLSVFLEIVVQWCKRLKVGGY